MAEHFSTSTSAVAAVVLTTVGIYLIFIVLVRVVGQRSLASMSSFDFACVVAFGAVLGRTVLLERPTLLTGAVALVTFFLVQGLLGMLTQNRRIGRMLNRAPVLLMAGERLLHDNMRKVHVSEDEIRQALRRAGIRRLEEVQAVVLERNGAVSVVNRLTPLDPWLVGDVVGAEQLAGPRG